MTDQHVGYENSMELAALQELCQLGPMLDLIEVGGLVVRMSPEPWRLMPTARFDKSIDDQLLFRRILATSMGL